MLVGVAELKEEGSGAKLLVSRRMTHASKKWPKMPVAKVAEIRDNVACRGSASGP